MKGLVIKINSNNYLVEIPPESVAVSVSQTPQIVSADIKGNMRLQNIRSTNPVVVGDWVEVDEQGWITEIYDRKNYIVRKSTNLSKQTHILAANIDLAILMVTITNPVTTTTFIDRFLATAEAYEVPICMIFNKIDLYNEAEKQQLQALMNLYQKIGYTCYALSCLDCEDVKGELMALLSHKITLLSGHSGVGKSSFINALSGETAAKVGDLSRVHHKGMHTTTFSQMYHLTNDIRIIDAPGIKGFGSVDMKKEEITHYFKDIFQYAQQCRFSDCSHTHEAHCAVLQAVKNGDIALSRYESYLNMLTDENEKYRIG